MATTARQTDSSIAIKASPRGTRAGFAVLSDGVGGAVTVTVLPKPWAPQTHSWHLTPHHQPGTNTHVTVHELDTLEISSTRSVVEALASAVLEVSGPAGRNQLLLERVRVERLGSPVAIADPSDFESLMGLLLLARRQRNSLESIGFSGLAVPSLMRLLTQHLFVGEVGRVIDRARLSYSERTEYLPGPRGKLSGASLALAMITRRPGIESTFDELSIDTAVLRIVLAALRVVATDRVPVLFESAAASVRGRATVFARRLDTVQVFDPERALLAARRLVLSPLDRPWSRAIGLAVQVLSEKAVLPYEGTASTPRAAAVAISMENWWEQCLAEALRVTADPGSVFEQSQIRVRAPWRAPTDATTLDESDSASKPDLLFDLSGETVLADAKYKIGDSLAAADAYQLFAYSHLTRRRPGSDVLTKRGAVLYPLPTNPTRPSRKHSNRPLIRTTDPTYELRLVDLPFPSKVDVRTDLAWNDYIGALATAIRASLTDRPALESS